MANKIFRQHATDLIHAAVRKAQAAGDIDHPGMRGRLREIATDELFAPFLPADFRIGSGKVTDAQGLHSSESDLIIHNPRLLPPVLYTPSGRKGIFPVEACFYVVEVKSRATSSEVADAVAKAARMRQLSYRSGWYSESGIELRTTIPRVAPVLFSFGSDLSAGGKTELERYSEHDPEWKSDPLIVGFCVAGVGCWHFSGGERRWRFWKPTPDYDEVIAFIGGVANTLPGFLESRRSPRLGHYLIGEDASELVSGTDEVY